MKKIIILFSLMFAFVTSFAQIKPNDIHELNCEIAFLKAEYDISNDKKIKLLESKRDSLVNLFSVEEKTINFNEEKESVLNKLHICGHWSIHKNYFNEQGKCETYIFEPHNDFYFGSNIIEKHSDYCIIFTNGKLTMIETHKTASQKIQNDVDDIKRKYEKLKVKIKNRR